MPIRFFSWSLKVLLPYLLGVLIGAGFFFILIRLLITPDGLLAKSPDFLERIAFLSKLVPFSLPERGGVKKLLPQAEDLSPQQSHTVHEASSRAAIAEVNKLSKEMPSPGSVDLSSGKMPIVQAPTESKPKKVPEEARVTSPEKPERSGGDCQPVVHGGSQEMERYMTCQWRKNCLARVEYMRMVIAQGLSQCPQTGANFRACRSYYYSLEQQNQANMCDRRWN